MANKFTALTGAAGEHYVACILSSLGYPVALTRGGSPTVDLMVGDITGEGTVSIQVKTARWAWRERKRSPDSAFWEWECSAKACHLRGDSIFYAFVDLRSFPQHSGLYPQVFIVPSAIVAGTIGADWIRKMFRISLAQKDDYFERWDYITSRLKPVAPPTADELQKPANA